MKILVVEDNTRIMRLIQVNLEQAGYEVVPADSAKEALILVAKEQPNLVVIDVSLPNMAGDELAKGDELARMLRQKQPHPKVLLMMAKAVDPEVIQRWMASADDHITMPFHPLALLALVEKLIGP